MVAELRLQITLFADEQRHHRVAVVAIDVQGLGYHRQEPAVEILWPTVVFGRQSAGEVLDIVLLAVPLPAACKELVDGVVVGDMG